MTRPKLLILGTALIALITTIYLTIRSGRSDSIGLSNNPTNESAGGTVELTTEQNSPDDSAIMIYIMIAKKEEEIKNLLQGKTGTFGVYIKWLSADISSSLSDSSATSATPDTSEPSATSLEINADRKFYAASLSKVPLLITLYHLFDEGELDRETKVAYLEQDYESGDGTIQNDPFGTEYTLEEIATRMAKESDNVAKNILYRILPWEEIVKTYKAAGVAPTTMENMFSPKEMAAFWTLLWQSESNLKGWILDLLTKTTTEDRIPAAVPEGIQVSHKTGTWNETGSWHDCGIVFAERPVLICVMSENSTHEEAVETIREVTKTALRL